MKLKKMFFNEEKMNEQCGELIEEKNLTACKPKGVGVFSFNDGPPAAGGGIGMFYWFKDWQEMYQFLANYLIPTSPGPANADHEVVYDKTWEIFNELVEGKIQRQQAFGQINAAAKSYSQIEWWGTLEELCEGQGEFEKRVRNDCLHSFEGKMGSAEKNKLMEAIAEYGL
jgi:hypothetical protein